MFHDNKLPCLAPAAAAWNGQLTPFMSPACRLLQRMDWFTQEKACRLLTAVLEARPNKSVTTANGAMENGHAESSSAPIVSAEAEGVQNQLAAFTEWLCGQLRCGPLFTPGTHPSAASTEPASMHCLPSAIMLPHGLQQSF